MSNASKTKDPGSTIRVIIIGTLIAAGLLGLSALPNFIHGHTSPKNACINNLRRIEGVKQQWALENHQSRFRCPGMGGY